MRIKNNTMDIFGISIGFLGKHSVTKLTTTLQHTGQVEHINKALSTPNKDQDPKGIQP